MIPELGYQPVETSRPVFALEEVFLLQLPGDGSYYLPIVNRTPRFFEHLRGDVRREDEKVASAMAFGKLAQNHRQGIGLFSRRAPGAPKHEVSLRQGKIRERLLAEVAKWAGSLKKSVLLVVTWSIIWVNSVFHSLGAEEVVAVEGEGFEPQAFQPPSRRASSIVLFASVILIPQ